MIGAIGVVYGDIGTSPLYAFGAAVKAADSAPLALGIFGSLSLIFWSLVFVVSLKYLVIILRADNEGEGGILALLARLEQHFYRMGNWSRHLLLAAVLARLGWKWSWPVIVVVFGTFFVLDTVFILGNLTKFAGGAWVPLAMAAAIFLIFTVWRDGRERLTTQLSATAVSMKELPGLLAGTTKVSGTAIFLASRPDSVPSAFLRNLEHNRVVHENVVFLHIGFRRVPTVQKHSRVDIETLQPSVHSVRAHYGFMEEPNVMEIIQQCNLQGLRIISRDFTLFLGQHVVVPLEQRRSQRWQRQFFAWLQRRSVGAAEFFGMPLRRVVILSTVVEI